ncbi:hypothetical protein ACQ3I4_09805 [Zafaria sp. Z1313]|uniref:hypothetical protein n=1 Tax=unclassified Zafaria TaxID=2828765 RepID=UPI002E79D98A|nr:hypothetical protein [Zafaria sp. J156]MEE1621786.1 hypothetical protein [Zafaria sp. J156]
MAVHTSGLPETLPSTAGIDTAARAVRKVGTDASGIYDDVKTEWDKLGQYFSSPHTDKVTSAVPTVMRPYVDASETLTDEVAKALEAFSDDISGLKTRYDNVKEQAAGHNAIAYDDRPDDYWDTNRSIQREIDAVAGLYDAAVEKCANAIRGLNPALGDYSGVGDLTGAVTDGADILEGVGLTAAHFKYKNGKLWFEFNTSANPFAQTTPVRHRISAGTLNRLGVPSSYIERLQASQGADPQRVSSNSTTRMLRGIDAQSPLGLLLARYPHLKNTRFNIRGQDVSLRVQLTRGNGTPPGSAGQANGRVRLPGWIDSANRFANGPAGKFLTAADYGATALGAYSEGYNESLLRNPDLSQAEHARVAATDAAVVTGSKAVGEVVGTAVGRGVGAAVGQALIPIPGVGAAVGGFLGGLAGGWIGGEIGEAVGGAINDLRHGDVGSLGEAAVDAGKKVLSSLNPFD